jgi:hypothetical protein
MPPYKCFNHLQLPEDWKNISTNDSYPIYQHSNKHDVTDNSLHQTSMQYVHEQYNGYIDM